MDRAALRIPRLCTGTLCQNNKNKATANSVWALWALMDFICVLQTYCWRSADGSGVTSVGANDDKRVGWWNFTTALLRRKKNARSLFAVPFTRLKGKWWLQMNILDLLWAGSPENKSEKRPSCARFVNEVKTSRAQTHCWHLVCDAALVFSGKGRWREAVEAITNPHSHKGASED